MQRRCNAYDWAEEHATLHVLEYSDLLRKPEEYGLAELFMKNNQRAPNYEEEALHFAAEGINLWIEYKDFRSWLIYGHKDSDQPWNEYGLMEYFSQYIRRRWLLSESYSVEHNRNVLELWVTSEKLVTTDELKAKRPLLNWQRTVLKVLEAEAYLMGESYLKPADLLRMLTNMEHITFHDCAKATRSEKLSTKGLWYAPAELVDDDTW